MLACVTLLRQERVVRHFTIVPSDLSAVQIELTTMDESALFHAVQTIGCHEAAIFEGDDYRFSLRLDDIGAWSIFRREVPAPKRLA